MYDAFVMQGFVGFADEGKVDEPSANQQERSQVETVQGSVFEVTVLRSCEVPDDEGIPTS